MGFLHETLSPVSIPNNIVEEGVSCRIFTLTWTLLDVVLAEAVGAVFIDPTQAFKMPSTHPLRRCE